MKVAAVILNYNSLNDTLNCVAQLQKQTGVELFVIVVDNQSSNESEVCLLRKICEGGNCLFMSAERNRGYNAGNNLGLRYAVSNGYQYVLIANPDMVFPQVNYVSTLVQAMEKDKNVVVAGSDIIDAAGYHQNPIAFFPEKFRDNFSWIRNLFVKDPLVKLQWNSNPEHTTYCSVLNGCCLLLRSDFLMQIGFFDERIFLFGEERILGKQVEMLGKKMLYEGHCQAMHNHKRSKEGSQITRFGYLKQSELTFIRIYSGYSSWKKWLLLAAVQLKYFLLHLKYRNH